MVKIAAYDDDAIWGLGDNEDAAEAEAQARSEAEGFMRDSLPEDAIEEAVAGLKTAPVADDLFDLTKAAEGGDDDPPAFKLDDGTLVIDEDIDAEGDGEEAEAV